jgi:hypothetical protein
MDRLALTDNNVDEPAGEWSSALMSTGTCMVGSRIPPDAAAVNLSPAAALAVSQCRRLAVAEAGC